MVSFKGRTRHTPHVIFNGGDIFFQQILTLSYFKKILSYWSDYFAALYIGMNINKNPNQS